MIAVIKLCCSVDNKKKINQSSLSDSQHLLSQLLSP